MTGRLMMSGRGVGVVTRAIVKKKNVVKIVKTRKKRKAVRH